MDGGMRIIHMAIEETHAGALGGSVRLVHQLPRLRGLGGKPKRFHL